jgi:hypothetical protein
MLPVGSGVATDGGRRCCKDMTVMLPTGNSDAASDAPTVDMPTHTYVLFFKKDTLSNARGGGSGLSIPIKEHII